MNRSFFGMVCVACVVSVACGGSGSNPDGGDGGDGGPSGDAGSSTINLSGAVTDSKTVAGPTTSYTPATNQGELDVRGDLSGVTTQVAFYFPGEPSLTTYHAASDGGINCSLQIYVNDGGLDGWAANFGAGLPDLGACSLTLTSSTVSADHSTQRSYAVHGSLTATAPAHAGAATGTVNYSASF